MKVTTALSIPAAMAAAAAAAAALFALLLLLLLLLLHLLLLCFGCKCDAWHHANLDDIAALARAGCSHKNGAIVVWSDTFRSGKECLK